MSPTLSRRFSGGVDRTFVPLEWYKFTKEIRLRFEGYIRAEPFTGGWKREVFHRLNI